jgi:hypothetical protein
MQYFIKIITGAFHIYSLLGFSSVTRTLNIHFLSAFRDMFEQYNVIPVCVNKPGYMEFSAVYIVYFSLMDSNRAAVSFNLI